MLSILYQEIDYCGNRKENLLTRGYTQANGFQQNLANLIKQVEDVSSEMQQAIKYKMTGYDRWQV